MKLLQILDSNISYSKKIEQICKLLPHEMLVEWSSDCAESVLYIYQEAYPEDSRPRQAIVAARSGDKNAAAYAAAYAAANAAANAAAYAAAYAAYAAADAANAAAYAAANAAYAAAYATKATSYANKSEKEQEQLNLMFLRKQVEIFESGLYQAMQELE